MRPPEEPSKQIAEPAVNARWLAADRVLRLGMGFIVQLLVVRHLGPSGNGILQSGLALAALAAVVVELGLDGIIKRELVRRPDCAGELLGTATALRLIALVPSVAVFFWAASREPGSTPALVAWLAFTVTLPLAQTPEAWLLSTGRVPANVLSQGLAFLLAALLRIGLVLGGAAAAAFGGAAAAETLLIALALVLAFASSPASPRRWKWNPALAAALWRDALPLLLTTLAITIYRRIDVVILSHLAGAGTAGVYAAAVRLSEVGYLAPMILINAWFPRLTRLHATDPAAYRVAMAEFFRRATWSGVAFATALTLAAPWLARGVFGPSFAGASMPLAIHAWTAVFIAHGVARSQWLLLENRQLDGLILAVGGALFNVSFNFAFVPAMGANGAALAALLALALNTAVLPALLPRVRDGWSLGWRAVFNLPPR